jgi:predicted ribosomally synthesized peptide with nif11-like leader
VSQDNLVKFLARIGNTPELHGKCKDGITAAQLIELGAENGFVFDLDDLRDGATLSDDEMAAIVGGASASKAGTREFERLRYCCKSAVEASAGFAAENPTAYFKVGPPC